MKKTHLILLLRWLVPSLILIGFLILPDVLQTASKSPLASNWIARLFFAIYLMNPFVGAAKVIERPEVVEAEDRRNEFYTPDEDSQKLFNMFGTLFSILSSTVVFYLGLGIFFSMGGFGKVVLTLLFAAVVGSMRFFVSRLSAGHGFSSTPRLE